MIAIIDYGSGNLRSVYNAFRYLKCDAKICVNLKELKRAKKIVLPGVGSSKDAMDGLKKRGLIKPLLQYIDSGMPFLGICLGLQLLFSASEESGGTSCLGLVKGKVKRFPSKKNLKIPQIGWNTVEISNKACPILRNIEDKTYFYFVHSYYCDVKDESLISGKTEYGLSYTSVLWRDNIFAVQFHPERSQANGLRVLENFVKL